MVKSKLMFLNLIIPKHIKLNKINVLINNGVKNNQSKLFILVATLYTPLFK